MATAHDASKIIEDQSLAEEKLLDELENDDIPSYIRDARLAEFKHQAAQFRKYKDKGHGHLMDIAEEKDFLNITTTEDSCIIHFYHEDFRRCSILNTHLEKLAEKYFETKFGKIDVTKAKFFVEKLKIQVLPAVLCFKKGVVIDRIVGFEDLGNSDSFSTESLETRLKQSGVIVGDTKETRKNLKILGYDMQKQRSDSDDDW